MTASLEDIAATPSPVDPYASGVLVKEVHDRLVAGIDKFALDAGIHKRWIWTRVQPTCSDAELAWAREFRRHVHDGVCAGMCYVGHPFVQDRMACLAGYFTRNFIRARVAQLGAVLEGHQAGDQTWVELSCLLIPNFHVDKSEGGTLSTKQISLLYDLLLARSATGVQTIIRIGSKEALSSDYGGLLARLVFEKFAMIHDAEA
jgi:hypothetical protein